MADTPRARVMGLITAGWTTQAIGVAARLKLFDRLAEGPRDAAALAAQTGSHPDALFRLLRALAALGLVEHLGGQDFRLSEDGRLLVSEAPGSIRGMALHWGERLWGALSQLDQSVRTGKAWSISGAGGFEQMAADPVQMEMFHQSMTDQTHGTAQAILDAYDFDRFGQVVDVGGSYGALIAALVKAHPELTGRSFDLPALQPAAEAYLRAAGVADRAGFVGGSFFEAVPAGADAYLLKMIIHDWYDPEAELILQRCRAAAGAKGLVLVMDRIVPEAVRPEEADYVTVRGDMLMLTAAGGKERTEKEFEALFARSGLRLERIIPTASGFSILEAQAA